MCSGIKVTCSFTMNCHAIIHINVCNWFTHLQPELQTRHIDDSIFTVHSSGTKLHIRLSCTLILQTNSAQVAISRTQEMFFHNGLG